MTSNDKFTKLQDSLKKMDSIILAYSGGVDSTLLLKAVSMIDLSRFLAVTAESESFPKDELPFAQKMAAGLNVEHRIIQTEELKDANYFRNPPDRCYFCKKELFGKLKDIASKENFSFIIDGTNADDINDWRPGVRAAEETGVSSPLAVAGIGKDEVRKISHELDLPTWNKPATPCLSSRFPYGREITAEALNRVERAENFIKELGISTLRVRDHSETARIEISPEEFRILMDKDVRDKVIGYLKMLGYKYITLDLQGFRSGSLNE